MKSQINHDLQELQFLCYILKTNASLLDLLFSESKFLGQLTYILKEVYSYSLILYHQNFFIINESVQPVHTAISNVTEEFVWISMGFCFLLKKPQKNRNLRHMRASSFVANSNMCNWWVTLCLDTTVKTTNIRLSICRTFLVFCALITGGQR